MNILYVGETTGTSGHRLNALIRLGHTVDSVLPEAALSSNRFARKLHYESGGLFMDRRVRQVVAGHLAHRNYDCAWVNRGRYVGPHTLRLIRSYVRGPIINYNCDDPFGGRDRFSWSQYLRSLPLYDLAVVVRDANVQEARSKGARNVFRVMMASDEVAHGMEGERARREPKPTGDVIFIGTWFPERGPFFANLSKLKVPFRIRGGRWNRAPEWPSLQGHFAGGETDSDSEYANLIANASVVLGLLSKGNRDQHTTRSMEIPHIGGLLCAERTPEHLMLYNEGEQALFFDDAAECADQCLSILARPDVGQEIALSGLKRSIQNRHHNERVASDSLAKAYNC